MSRPSLLYNGVLGLLRVWKMNGVIVLLSSPLVVSFRFPSGERGWHSTQIVCPSPAIEGLLSWEVRPLRVELLDELSVLKLYFIVVLYFALVVLEGISLFTDNTFSIFVSLVSLGQDSIQGISYSCLSRFHQQFVWKRFSDTAASTI
jgi:hypothetical protein